jgi:hypothetical protein
MSLHMTAEVVDIKVIKFEFQNSKNRGLPPFSKFEKSVSTFNKVR